MINKESFEKFSRGMMLTAVGNYHLASLITFDFTAIKAFESIQESTDLKGTEEQRYLHQQSRKMLQMMGNLRQEVRQEPGLKKQKPPHQRTDSSLSFINELVVMEEETQNNENVNQMNFIPATEKPRLKTKVVELKEIVRPEYRRKVTHASVRLRNQSHHNHFITESEQEDLPLITEGRRERRHKIKRSDRSVSPKVERGRPSGISSISRQCHTQTDASFEIDLQGMGIHPVTARDKLEIQQEEPWQCEEDELEEQLRQIDERLSQRGNKTQEIILPSYQEQIDHSPRNGPKKVRLSLTPLQARSTTPSKSRMLTPKLKRRAQPQNTQCQLREPTKTYAVNYLSEKHPVQKWNKPQSRLLTTQIMATHHQYN